MTKPSPQEIINARTEAGLTQVQASGVVGCTSRTWQRWEAGTQQMKPALFAYFLSEIKNLK